LEGPTRPDLRETVAYVDGFEDRSLRTARSAALQPPSMIGDDSRRQALHYTELLRALDAIGETVDRLNSQVRTLLTRVACELAQDQPPRRDVQEPTGSGP
jgi:hypothetical protein